MLNCETCVSSRGEPRSRWLKKEEEKRKIVKVRVVTISAEGKRKRKKLIIEMVEVIFLIKRKERN